jgi:spore maturation protein CgeB
LQLRLQTIATKYPAYLHQFYAQRPGLGTQSYAEQHAALMADAFGAPETRSVAMGALGYETGHVFANAEPMQRRWALEQGHPFDESVWLLDITRAQVRAFQPDVLFVNNYAAFPAPFLRRIRPDCPSIRLVLGWCGAPYRDGSVFGEYDVVLSNIPELVQGFGQDGHRSYHLNHAFDPRVLDRIETARPPRVDFAFVGSIAKGAGSHDKREELLLHLLEATDLDIWSEARQPRPKKRLGTLVRQFAYDALHLARRVGVPEALLGAWPPMRRAARWKDRPDLSAYVDGRIARRARPPLFGLAMFQQLHDSRVALNTHIDISSLSASNMRLYEATGVGTCLLTDWKENLPDLFEPDVEVVTYRDVSECVEKVEHLLAHEDERQTIAAAGQRRTLRDHTVDQRAEQLDEVIRSHMRGKVAR